MLRMVKGAIAGACLMAAVPASAAASEAAASSGNGQAYPLILNRSAVPVKPASHPMILSRPANPDVFGTVALNAGVTFYDARFRRVSAADARDPLVQRLAAGVAGLNPMEKIAAIQAAVEKRVRWAHDLENLGVADYWDNAGDTLRRGTGDSEDIAIVKMQALKAAGVDPKDLYLSIGRDAKRGAHILLLVHTAAGFIAMDDHAAAPMSAALKAKFTPIMTVGQGMSWIHGRRIGRMASSGTVKASAR